MINQKFETSLKNGSNHINQNLKKIVIGILLKHTVWVLVILTIFMAMIFIPRFGSAQNLLNIFVHMIPLGITIYAMGLCLMTGFFDLSLESTYALAPIIGVIVMTKLLPDFPGVPYVGMVITIIVGMIVGLINGILSIKMKINPFLITLCMMLILRGLSLYLIPAGIFNLPKVFIFLGSYRVFNNALPVSVICFIILVIGLNWLVNKKPFGRHLLAVGSNERAAYLTGIKTERVKITVFAFAGMLAAFAGLIAAGRQHAVFNSMGEGNMVLMFAGAVLGGVSLQGGVGSITGILGGVVLLQILSNIITLANINPFLVKTVYGSILLIALILQSLRSKLNRFI